MSFASLSEFFRMGTHGVYVWTAYGLTLTTLVAIHLYVCRHQGCLRHTLDTLKRHDDAR